MPAPPASPLDAVLMPLRVNTEKTYSAPLATNLFSMDVSEDGQTRLFPGVEEVEDGEEGEGGTLEVGDGEVGGAAVAEGGRCLQ